MIPKGVDNAVEIAGDMMALGIDPTVFLTTDDDTLRNLLAEVTGRAIKTRQKLDENLATMIANNVGKLFKG